MDYCIRLVTEVVPTSIVAFSIVNGFFRIEKLLIILSQDLYCEATVNGTMKTGNQE